MAGFMARLLHRLRVTGQGAFAPCYKPKQEALFSRPPSRDCYSDEGWQSLRLATSGAAADICKRMRRPCHIKHDNTDLARFEVLALRYRSKADICLEMAAQTDDALRRQLVLAAARWIELAQETEARDPIGLCPIECGRKSRPLADSMAIQERVHA